jgi:hypothetical protein
VCDVMKSAAYNNIKTQRLKDSKFEPVVKWTPTCLCILLHISLLKLGIGLLNQYTSVYVCTRTEYKGTPSIYINIFIAKNLQ